MAAGHEHGLDFECQLGGIAGHELALVDAG